MVLYGMDATFDSRLRLKDSSAHGTGTTVGQVDGADASLYIGAGRVKGEVKINVTACDVANTDEVYKIQLVGNADGAWGSTHVLAELTLGIAASIPNQVNKTTGFYSLPFINAAPLTAGAEPSYLGYLRIRTIGSGTTPSVTYEAWVAKDE